MHLKQRGEQNKVERDRKQGETQKVKKKSLEKITQRYLQNYVMMIQGQPRCAVGGDT